MKFQLFSKLFLHPSHPNFNKTLKSTENVSNSFIFSDRTNCSSSNRSAASSISTRAHRTSIYSLKLVVTFYRNSEDARPHSLLWHVIHCWIRTKNWMYGEKMTLLTLKSSFCPIFLRKLHFLALKMVENYIFDTKREFSIHVSHWKYLKLSPAPIFRCNRRKWD